MRRTLAGALDRLVGSTVEIVWQGKVKPLRYELIEVLSDALLLRPVEGAEGVSALHPIVNIQSITAAAE